MCVYVREVVVVAFLLGAAFLGCDVAKAAAAPVGWGAKRRAQTATDKSNQVERQPEREREGATTGRHSTHQYSASYYP